MQHVLKANQVQLEGSLQLGIDQTTTRKGNGSHPGSSVARVRIAEAHPEFAVLEVTCACGRTTLVRCDYAATNVAAAVTTGAGGQEPVPGEEQEIGPADDGS